MVADCSSSFPGALGMYALSLGISRVGNTLPDPVYSLLSGLSAATVGIIALAAVRLAGRAITDKLTRLLVYFGGAMGMLYTALWYYPVLMLSAGVTTLAWDMRWLQRLWNGCCVLLRGLRTKSQAEKETPSGIERGPDAVDPSWEGIDKPLPPIPDDSTCNSFEIRAKSASRTRSFSSMSWQLGTSILAVFLAVFALTIALHAVAAHPSRSFSLFSSLYLAGTIIFGGGPVVIPLLKEYIVTPGWVSPRDFLLGLAIIQAFPGPNFNIAVYLGSIAVARTSVPSSLGALIAFVAIYTPGLLIVTGFMGLWSLLHHRAWFLSILRGVNASAVGLVFTAVYKLWQIGCLTATDQSGSPLGTSPWLVAITGTAFVGSAWFGLSPPIAIILGGGMGVAKWAAIDR